MSLSVVMRHAGRLTQGADAANGEIDKLWVLAEVQSLRELSSFDYARRAWALGNLIELYLLAPVDCKEAPVTVDPSFQPSTAYSTDRAGSVRHSHNKAVGSSVQHPLDTKVAMANSRTGCLRSRVANAIRA
jgi:hypothetical protein